MTPLTAIVLLDPIIHQSYITTGGQIIIAMLVATTTLLGGQNWVIGRRAKTAVDQTKATGNGYARHTSEALARIEAAVAGVATDVRATNGRVDELTARFNKHTDPTTKEN